MKFSEYNMFGEYCMTLCQNCSQTFPFNMRKFLLSLYDDVVKSQSGQKLEYEYMSRCLVKCPKCKAVIEGNFKNIDISFSVIGEEEL